MEKKCPRTRETLLIAVTLAAMMIVISLPPVLYYNSVPDICPNTNKTDILFFCSMDQKICNNVKFFDIYELNMGALRHDIETKDVCFGFPKCEEYKPTYEQLMGLVERDRKQIKHQYDHILVERYGVTEAPSVYLCDEGILLSGREAIKKYFKEN